MIEIYSVIGILMGLVAGLYIDRNARKERDEEIARLSKENTTLKNVCDSNNDTINRLRRECERLKKELL